MIEVIPDMGWGLANTSSFPGGATAITMPNGCTYINQCSLHAASLTPPCTHQCRLGRKDCKFNT